jgi:hypothetical protein
MVGELFLMVKAEARRAELDVVVDELVSRVVGDYISLGFCFGLRGCACFP